SGYTDGKKVYRSTDAGQTWQNMSFDMPNLPANCVIMEKSPEGGVYVGTDAGVFYWQEGATENQRIERRPREFGVPVTTLVGYYDPQGQLTGYIYPPLHGAYGFTYADDGSETTDQDCLLLVETRRGPLRFRLANQRFNTKVMNKFHVNIPESSQPQSVSLVCRGKVIDTKSITPPATQLSYTQTPSPER
ncbi:MAG: TagA domain-containing protein, partial [Planctomycetaceae bacterium]